MVAVNSHLEFQVKSSNIPPHNRALVSAALLFARVLETLQQNCLQTVIGENASKDRKKHVTWVVNWGLA